MIRVDSEKLAVLSAARSFIEDETSRLEYRLTLNSSDVSSLKRQAMANERDRTALGKGKAETSYKKLLKKLIKSYERKLESIEGEIREANERRLPFLLLRLNQKKANVEPWLGVLRKRMADIEASFNASLAKLEENRRVIEAKLIAMDKDAAALRESLEFKTDALGYCTTAVAMTEQVYLLRLRKLRFDGYNYIKLVDTIDVNVLRSICVEGSGCRGVVLKFYVAKDELLKPVATAIKKEGFVPRLDRLYELSVDEDGKCSIFEQSVKEAAACGFKR